jgi:hypothetical protein
MAFPGKGDKAHGASVPRRAVSSYPRLNGGVVGGRFSRDLYSAEFYENLKI